jgi:cell division septation protein DedD
MGAAITPARGDADKPGTVPPGSSPRFAVEFGPFFSATEAERVERRLSDAGYQTVRFRQHLDAAVYAVLIERVPSAHDAQALVVTLREQGFAGAAVEGTTAPLTVRVGEPIPLRAAVQLAERLRGSGHQVRVAAAAGEALTFIVRHGNFVAREHADARSQELIRLGLPNQAVQVK